MAEADGPTRDDNPKTPASSSEGGAPEHHEPQLHSGQQQSNRRCRKVAATSDYGRSRVLGPEHSDVLKCMNGLTGIYQRERRYADAEKLERQALETERRVLGPDRPETLESMNNLGETLQSEATTRKRRNCSVKLSLLSAAFLDRRTRIPCR